MFGQIPTNGGWRDGDGGGGIFGQVPTNGGYVIGGAARRPSLGQFPMGTLYASPPAYNDGGLLRIDQSAAPAFLWSINSTTTDDPVRGATFEEDPGFAETYLMEVVSAKPGNDWLTTYMAAGYVILFGKKSVEELGPSLSFVATTDPRAVAHYAAYEANNYMIVGGPEPIIAAAKTGGPVSPTPGPTPGLPGDLPGTLPSGGCPEGTVGVPPACVPIPGAEPPGTSPPGTEPPPGTTPPGTEPPPDEPSNGKPADSALVAGTEAPAWLLPALVGVAGLSVFVIIRASRKQGRAS